MLSSRIQELTQKADPPFLYGQAGYSGFLSNLDGFSSIVVAKGDNIEGGLESYFGRNCSCEKIWF
jgi:zinc protease